MSKETLISNLIANTASKFEEGDKEELEKLPEAVLEKMQPEDTPEPNAPVELQSVLRDAMTANFTERESLVTELTENSDFPYTKEELYKKDNTELKKLAEFVRNQKKASQDPIPGYGVPVNNYAGAAPVANTTGGHKQAPIPEPTWD